MRSIIDNIDKNYNSKKILVGIDEAGRGPLAGPVFAAAVIVDMDNMIDGINDSKKLSPGMREYLFEHITKNYQYGIGIATHEEIDEINILNASILACNRAYDNLGIDADIVLVDGNMKFKHNNFFSIVKGDQKSISIAAASIVAKVSRDRYMKELHQLFPQYNWLQNKGYPTRAHVESISRFGLCKFHRKSFKIKY